MKLLKSRCDDVASQHERHDGKESFSKEGYHLEYGLTNERATRLQKHAIIMIQRQSIGMLNWQMN